MITRIYARGFKGMDFDQPLALRTVFTGRIGSGKSSRALALALLVTGSLPGTGIAKSNGDILNAVGNGDSLTVGIEFDDGVTLERSYKRKKNGAVGCEYRNAGESVPKNLFELDLDRRGVSIADVSAFLALSDSKKVDELFRLFPPSGDVRSLNSAINRAKEQISTLENNIRAREQSCRSITESLADMQVPVGNLPEIQASIAQIEREYQTARDELTAERTRLDIESHSSNQYPQQPAPVGQMQLFPVGHEESVEALERVLSALERSGCDGCAAKMVLKRELKALRTNV